MAVFAATPPPPPPLKWRSSESLLCGTFCSHLLLFLILTVVLLSAGVPAGADFVDDGSNGGQRCPTWQAFVNKSMSGGGGGGSLRDEVS